MRALAALLALLALPAWALTFSVDPASTVDIVHRKNDTSGSVIVMVDKSANVQQSGSASPTAKNITVSTNGKLSIVRCKTACVGKVVVQADKSAMVSVADAAPAPTPTPVPSPTTSDFATRCRAAGVVRCFGFESSADLRGPLEPNGADPTYLAQAGEKTTPTLDTTIAASGQGSLRFDVPSLSSSNAAGAFYANFSDDLSVRFGENSEFYVQWRQRFNQAFIDTFFTEDWGDGKSHAQGGIKQIILSPGDTPIRTWDSCEANDLVLTTYYQHRIPVGYNSCVGSASHGAYAGFYESVPPGPSDWKLQNATSPACLYSQNQGSSDGPGCFVWRANEWMTFKVWVKLGPRNLTTGEFDNSEVKVWAAHAGQPSQLLIWWRPGIPGYFPLTAGSAADDQRLGKVWLLPYMTGKDSTQVHPLCQTWYDDLIISRQDIADPQ